MSTPLNIPDNDWRIVRQICRRHGVDPLLIVAIGWCETHWFTKGDGLKGNGLGVGSYDSGSTYRYAGVRAQVTRACEILLRNKVTSIVDIAEGKLHATGRWNREKNRYVGPPGSVRWASADTADGGPHGGPAFPWSRNVIKTYARIIRDLAKAS